MIRLAIMQGRLSPPEDGRIQCFPRLSWQKEFSRAVEAGIPAIEWIDDTYGADINPLRTEEGIKELQKLMKQHGVNIPSICADTFMEQPLVRCTEAQRQERLKLLEHLFRQAKLLGAHHIGIPLLDNSALKNLQEIDEAATALLSIIPILEELQMELHLETSLSPKEFPILLWKLPHPLIKVTYDTGNSASLGYDPHEEFSVYGSRIGSVHIKDRKRGGGTVELGMGDTDFEGVAEELKKIELKGLYTLQAARKEANQEIALLKEYRIFVEQKFKA
ncbi:MAG: xylose isomerase-like TIM barrel [Candidatus Peregrinibacteria bacterium Greene1014_49]|nr:MAG: xylose isomerase-like TIM barrel [Candidatus Peregrinibacteria bacterium Greene1014_49]